MEFINPKKLFKGAFVPDCLLERGELSPGAKLCYGAMAEVSDEEGFCNPGQEEIGRRLGVERRQVIRYLQELEKRGLIRRERSGNARPNRYLFTMNEWMKAALQIKGQSDVSDVSHQATSDVSDVSHQAAGDVTDMSHQTPKNGAEVTYMTHHSQRTIINKIPYKEKIVPGISVPSTGESEDQKIYLELSKKFYEGLFKQKPVIKNGLPGNYLTKGAEEFRKLIEIDGAAPEQCRRVIEWVRNHRGNRGFSWADQVLTPAKLRKRQPDGNGKKNGGGVKYFFLFLELMERGEGRTTQGVLPGAGDTYRVRRF